MMILGKIERHGIMKLVEFFEVTNFVLYFR